MITTIATFEETDEQLEEAMRHVREKVVPSIRGAKGLRAGYWMVDRGASFSAGPVEVQMRFMQGRLRPAHESV